MIEFNWINNCISILRIFLFSKWFRSKNKKASDRKDIFILANGPSLNDEIAQLSSDFFINRDVLVVNYFVFSELYEKFQPKYYVLSAPDFFYDTPSPDFVENVDKLFTGIENRTSWEMTLYIPFLAKKHKKWQSRIKNPKIKIHYYNTAVAEGSYSLVKFMLNKQLGMPRVQNVLIPSLVFMIQKRVKDIYLFGVDHSWLRQINVNEQNDVLMSHPHFYEKKIETTKVKKNEQDTRKLHEVLHKFYFTFKSYFTLRRYAQDKGIRIYNLTKGSYIDAFDRLEINKLEEHGA